MHDVRKWPRFIVTVTMEVAAPCVDAAEELAEEYATSARNDNGVNRAPFTSPTWSDRVKRPTEPAYVVAAERGNCREKK